MFASAGEVEDGDTRKAAHMYFVGDIPGGGGGVQAFLKCRVAYPTTVGLRVIDTLGSTVGAGMIAVREGFLLMTRRS